MSAASASYSRGWRIALGLVVPVTAIVAWELSARFGTVPSYLIAPSAIFATTWEMALSGELWEHTRASLLRALGGYAIGGAAGNGGAPSFSGFFAYSTGSKNASSARRSPSTPTASRLIRR